MSLKYFFNLLICNIFFNGFSFCGGGQEKFVSQSDEMVNNFEENNKLYSIQRDIKTNLIFFFDCYKYILEKSSELDLPHWRNLYNNLYTYIKHYIFLLNYNESYDDQYFNNITNETLLVKNLKILFEISDDDSTIIKENISPLNITTNDLNQLYEEFHKNIDNILQDKQHDKQNYQLFNDYSQSQIEICDTIYNDLNLYNKIEKHKQFFSYINQHLQNSQPINIERAEDLKRSFLNFIENLNQCLYSFNGINTNSIYNVNNFSNFIKQKTNMVIKINHINVFFNTISVFYISNENILKNLIKNNDLSAIKTIRKYCSDQDNIIHNIFNILQKNKLINDNIENLFHEITIPFHQIKQSSSTNETKSYRYLIIIGLIIGVCSLILYKSKNNKSKTIKKAEDKPINLSSNLLNNTKEEKIDIDEKNDKKNENQINLMNNTIPKKIIDNEKLNTATGAA